MRIKSKETVEHMLASMSSELLTLLGHTSLEQLCMVGIQRGGVDIAEHLAERLNLKQAIGTLNIHFYRDDFSRIGLHPEVGSSSLPWDIEDRTVILVDDVLYSGRTVRAAINTLFDYGRPARIILVVLVERDGHELPIRADIKGIQLSLSKNQQVKLDPQSRALLLVESAPRVKP